MPDKKTTHHYLDGRWIKGQGEPFVSRNPADNRVIWEGASATVAEIVSACDAARNALKHWSSLDFCARVEHILRFGKRVESHKDELALLISLETGKPRWESMTEVAAVVGKIALSIKAYQERTSDVCTQTSDTKSGIRYKPQGVVAVLGPFNFPAHLSNGHIVPALLAGNTVVYKPSELAPAVAQWIIQCWHDSGLPAGVINVIQGPAASAKTLLKQDIQAVYFTGSYHAGLQIHRSFSDKPNVLLALEMGGNNALVIDHVDDTKAAVYHTLLSSFITAGQRCTSARRVLIAKNAAGDQFLECFINATKKIKVGVFTSEPEPFMGPVISHTHAKAHLDAQQALVQAGGNPLIPMTLIKPNTGFLSPGIIDMSLVKNPSDEEIFAPCVQIYRYDDFDNALELANQTRFGLIAGLLSNDPAHYQRFYHAVRTGLVHWNKPTTGAASSLPFGGTGQSGNHRPSGYFAADYCAYPVAIQEQPLLTLPEQRLPGIEL